MSTKVLGEFKKISERIEAYRSELKSFLDGKIEEHIIDGIIAN